MQDSALANIMNALSNPRRVGMMRLLLSTKDPLTVTFIAAHLGIQDGPTSYGLKMLLDVGLVSRIPSGKYVFFKANRTVMRDVIRFWRMKPEVNFYGNNNEKEKEGT